MHETHGVDKAQLVAEIDKLTSYNKRLEENVFILQKSNEETEALLKTGEPELYNIKIRLIEANNKIARYKGQIKSS